MANVASSGLCGQCRHGLSPHARDLHARLRQAFRCPRASQNRRYVFLQRVHVRTALRSGPLSDCLESLHPRRATGRLGSLNGVPHRRETVARLRRRRTRAYRILRRFRHLFTSRAGGLRRHVRARLGGKSLHPVLHRSVVLRRESAGWSWSGRTSGRSMRRDHRLAMGVPSCVLFSSKRTEHS